MPPPAHTASYRVEVARWTRDEDAIRAVRTEVFVEEQGIDHQLEWDGHDGECLHVLAIGEGGTPIGTGRLKPRGKIERMAVVRTRRGEGIGTAILSMLLDEAGRRGLTTATLAAQDRAVSFYERHGFRKVGGPHIEAGILHQRMERDL